MPDNQKSKLWEFLIIHFGGNSKGVQNWLVLTVAFILITLSIGFFGLALGFFGLTIGFPLFFGLLIGFGAITLVGIIGTLISSTLLYKRASAETTNKDNSSKHSNNIKLTYPNQSQDNSFATPLSSSQNNVAILKPGEKASYNPTTKVFTIITEGSVLGTYDYKPINQSIDQITFSCCTNPILSSYLMIAYNQISKEYIFLNISQSQAKDSNVCQRFFQQYNSPEQDAKFDILFFKIDPLLGHPPAQLVFPNNIESFIDSNKLISEETPLEKISKKTINNELIETRHIFVRAPVREISFTLSDRQLTKFCNVPEDKNAKNPSWEKYRSWDISNGQKLDNLASPSC